MFCFTVPSHCIELAAQSAQKMCNLQTVGCVEGEEQVLPDLGLGDCTFGRGEAPNQGTQVADHLRTHSRNRQLCPALLWSFEKEATPRGLLLRGG